MRPPAGRPCFRCGADAPSCHHFRLLDRLDDGWKPFWLDTLLVPAGQSDHIAFVADNPGKWRLGAHLVGPAGARWIRWFEVT